MLGAALNGSHYVSVPTTMDKGTLLNMLTFLPAPDCNSLTLLSISKKYFIPDRSW